MFAKRYQQPSDAASYKDVSGRALLRRDLSEGTHRISRGDIGSAAGARLVRWKGADGRVWSGRAD